ncbi:MAG TPA: electron transport complex subunit RsxC, partial [Povalibacter sp.]|nr:electron transport complex subunit RsxC [Povalibacter sp.]
MTRVARGGLWLDAHKERSAGQPVRSASIPEEIVLPLDQHAGAAATPMVAAGDSLLLGQPVAQPQSDISAWIHSPVSGTVIAVEPRAVAAHAEPVTCVVIRNDRQDRSHPGNAPLDFASLQPAALCEHIARGGIVGLGGATFPTALKLLQAGHSAGTHLLLNGAECEPWISCDDALMRERAGEVILGAQILRHALGAARCTIAVEDDVPEAVQALQAAVAGSDIRVAVVPSIYPAGGERQLILAVFGVEVPTDGLPSDVGIVCQNVGTAAAVARWLRDGQPLISRIVTVTGSGVREPANLEVRLGTPIASLVADCGGYVADPQRLIMGGSMMGTALRSDALPVVKAMNCVIVATGDDLSPRSSEMPCIRCGNCSQVCPASLLPQQLHWHALSDDLPALETLGLMDCIECGCCDHVCPSQIPLTQRFREAKPRLQARIAARGDAAAARERFESREQRLT